MTDWVELAPAWLTHRYVALLRGIKYVLGMRLLSIMDNRAKMYPAQQGYHYLRSLLALHQLEDMIALDVPWWTYSAITAIDTLLAHRQAPITAFEYGSGASTLWLAQRCTHVTSIEHDRVWFEKLQPLIQGKSIDHYLYEPDFSIKNSAFGSDKMKNGCFEKYVTAIEQQATQYDIIVIDGRARAACLRAALPYLKSDGFIVFDNANRARYQAALIDCGLKVKRYKGRVPGSPLSSETAVLHIPKKGIIVPIMGLDNT